MLIIGYRSDDDAEERRSAASSCGVPSRLPLRGRVLHPGNGAGAGFGRLPRRRTKG